MKIVFAGLMEVLTRWFACQRSLKGDSQALQIVGRSGGAVFSRRVYRYDHGSAADAHAQMEARSVAEALGASDASFSDDEWERCLPQITTALVDHSPSRLAVASSAHRQLLSFALRDALVQRIVAKPEMGLKTCWLLQDALLEERNTLEAGSFGDVLFRECWAASHRVDTCKDSAAFVGALVRVSEHLAKVERTKRRDPRRLEPMLHALNDWLAPRALAGGVDVPLFEVASGASLRVLRIHVASCRVMPSRARAPTLLYCEAIERTADGGAAPVLNLDDEARRWAPVVAPTRHGHAFDVVDSFLNTGGRLDFEAARRNELLARVYEPQIWEEQEAAAKAASPYGANPGWRLASFLVKADDELRREQLASQFAEAVADVLDRHGVDAYLRPYGIICCGPRAGLVETLADAKSLDHVKQQLKSLDMGTDLGAYFDAVYGPYDENQQVGGAPNRKEASLNFARSLAGSSLLSYALDVKDRHNGNILLDRGGRLIHIDFGYMLGRSPGGLNFEDAPFKLPQDYVHVLGGVGSDAWVAFATAFAAGLHALALELHRLQTLLVLFFGDSNVGLEAATALGERFRGLGQDPRQTMAAATDMIRRSHDSDRAKQYDWYQWKTNGIVP